MSSSLACRTGVAVICAIVLGAGVIDAQKRYEAAGRETVAAVPGLEIVTVRDNLLNTCYTLFIMEPARPTPSAARAEPSSVEAAAGERDRRLSALSTEFEQAQFAAMPGTLGANPLRYQWEGDKVQSEYERRLREKEFTRLEEALAEIASGPRLAVAGPAPCGAAPAASGPAAK